MRKKINPLVAFWLMVFMFYAAPLLHAQNMDDPGDYMTAIYNAQQEMDQTYMSYMSAAAHSGRAKKIEKMREQTLQSIENCRYKVIDLPYYKKDNSLRQSSIDYIQLCYKVFNEDYAHIVNMEEIAEQSFDEMEAYLLMKEKTNQKINEASEKMNRAADSFAARYNVKVIASKSELEGKLETASKLNHYHNQVYLLFFKCYWQDGKLRDALATKKVTDIEQARNALITYAAEGLSTLDTLKVFEGDPLLAATCRKSLNFYKKMGETDAKALTDFFIASENFEKMKKTLDAKPENTRTKEDIAAYNKSVAEFNAAVNKFNEVGEKISKGRNQVINEWNENEKTFLDTHMPYYK